LLFFSSHLPLFRLNQKIINFFPVSFIAATNQRGFAPLPAHASPSGPRYFAATFLPANGLTARLPPIAWQFTGISNQWGAPRTEPSPVSMTIAPENGGGSRGEVPVFFKELSHIGLMLVECSNASCLRLAVPALLSHVRITTETAVYRRLAHVSKMLRLDLCTAGNSISIRSPYRGNTSVLATGRRAGASQRKN
jgi:hypothetical protein